MKIKVKIIKCIIIFLTLNSCNNKESESRYYPSGNLKSSKEYNEKNRQLEKTIIYYDTLNEKKMKIFYHLKTHDSIVYYYKNGNVFKKGNQDKSGNLFGKWNYYTREGFLSDVKEYFLINNEFDHGYILNQKWYFNKFGDTMYYGNNKFNIYNQKEFELQSKGEKTSIFIRFDFHPKGDTLSIAEPFTAFAEDAFPFWEKMNSESYVVLAKEKYNFNNDFSNEKEVKLDTFFSLEKDKVNIKSFPKANKKHTVAFGRWFDTTGKKVLRGYMVEYYEKKATASDSVRKRERRTYFEKHIYVKDTI